MSNPNSSPHKTANPRTIYLTLYNLLLASLWLTLLLRTLTHYLQNTPPQALFASVSPLARYTQTLTLLEPLHCATGLVKAPFRTTAIQVFTRVIQVWMIWYCFPTTTGSSPAFGVLMCAWAAADVVRYFYLTLNMWGKAGREIVWLRYSMFIVLYPVGIGAEWWLMYRSVEAVGRVSRVSRVGEGVWWFLLALYGPGAYTMFTYMVRQRRKVLGRGGGQKSA
ncbi:PTPLA-domain-containing protein [Bimuria novae-zelandiae CBS 107.79]|uniref:Very-long-chain (3R)-3-hydroxyacyl-CoA dehydratase n=1 Tax=Bimuria novae-zelandiae CBS 107.79 TaxID=1447943 RepID=A0A6A5V3Q0_9PLEO|nr:PTPLA-domain-containing protein [Bimuria novae-zelandiae CBS 107.79]